MGLRVGVVGLGRIGRFHTATLRSLAHVDELVVTDPVPAAVDAVVDEFGCRAVATADEVIDAVDAVVIAAATPAHAPLITSAVAAGVPAFCEKPIAASGAESAEIARLVSDANAFVQIGYNRRFDPAVAAARSALVTGDLGFVTTVRSTTFDPAPPPPDYVAASGGIFRDCAVHDFDTVRWILGDEVVEVYAVGANQGDRLFTDVGDVDTATVVLTFARGTIGVVSVSRYNGRGYDCRLELHGSADTVVAGWDASTPVRNVDPRTEFPTGVPHGFFMDRFAAAYRAELTAFCDAVVGDLPSPCPVTDALEVAVIADAATRSLHEHRPVPTAEIRPADPAHSTIGPASPGGSRP
ncbi:Gfo/Idh/MocA family protein [Gordonia soli]|uniref:Myo-inositol 2-dehydrogenase n=1 Tax=Gordonia soli NBRC 108243 TaxID=1223545 RepID=M0QEE7_9ACTN|nr:Gfo/Idh/MocA family oxidoreductase [Gordonia soli]GAC66701.1 myo-inositol 2-dehydrogenase [Gordonia soli NBRC 108243]